jgi:excisionase family DNA binding protein
MDMLTTRQVAERLGVTMKRVQAMIRDERLPAAKAGRDYMIRVADLSLVADRKPGRPPKQKIEAANGQATPKRAAKKGGKK